MAPIFQQKCQACHRPGYIAPMSLVTYAESRPWARSIRTRVETRQMPPWHIDKSVGIQDFENDRSLTDEEIDTIVRWVDAGAPRGNPEDMPPPVEFADDDVWNYAGLFGGPPDLVVYSTPYTVPAVAQDRWWKPEVPTGLTEDRWIRAIEIRPSSVEGRRVTHHALARLQQEEDDDLGAASDVGPGLLMEWAVGKQGEIMRPNSGKLIKAGASILWDVHYHAVGEEITDTVELGLYLYPKGEEPKHRQVLSAFSTIEGGSDHLSIPPNQVTITERFHVLKQNGRVENYQPHMHLRGKGMQMTAILPDGDHRGPEPRERLQLQLAPQLRVRRPRGAAAAEGDRAAPEVVVRTTRRATGRTPIPTSGSATATGPSTRWGTPGSTSPTWTTTTSPRPSPSARRWRPTTISIFRRKTGSVRPGGPLGRQAKTPGAALVAGAAPLTYEEADGMRVEGSAEWTTAVVLVLALAAGAGAAGAQVPGTLQEFGAPVYPAYEGWYENPDGSITLLAGYFNANTEQIVDLPVGAGNYIEPGPADQGQPTHFTPGRSWGVFTVRIPGGDPDARLIWHLTANGETVSIPMHLDPLWVLEPFEDAANGNKPPVVRFAPDGEEFTGPPIGIARELAATVGAPLELAVWTSDEKPTDNLVAASRRPRPALILRWHVLRGPGEVEFSAPVQEFADSSDQNPATTATFAAAGDYVLRAEALDETGVGGSGFQCCWTSALVAVRVSE